jgi:hypothetical protein
MTIHTKAFHDAHNRISERTQELRCAAQRFPSLSVADRECAREEILEFLDQIVVPHMWLDEHQLYPEVTLRFGQPLITSSMNYDHLAIRRWAAEIRDADVGDTDLLQQLLYGLDALIRVHLWKEDALFLDPVESNSWPSSC